MNNNKEKDIFIHVRKKDLRLIRIILDCSSSALCYISHDNHLPPSIRTGMIEKGLVNLYIFWVEKCTEKEALERIGFNE